MPGAWAGLIKVSVPRELLGPDRRDTCNAHEVPPDCVVEKGDILSPFRLAEVKDNV